ncbi:hypothetical protein [Clostridium celatum]|uniref:hypothetical protein n=1 Tax=Clostridium celatum TaxID=36834 RepID=UPI00290243D2|nr:hypothetical protein [Clostridium celatum]MDU2265216.1 hypothetical protein [Clostridium celatum]MDU6295942.1 hypothetical protein [Clostridium celatum]
MEASLFFIIVKCILAPIIAVFLVNKWNFFESVTIIPNDYAFEFGLAAYLGFLEWLYAKIVCKIKENEAKIECLFYCSGQQESIESNPAIEFRDEVAYINGKINVSGKVKKLCKNNVLIVIPNWVDIQIDGCEDLIIVENNVCKIKIDKIINSRGTNTETTSVKFKIGLIKNYSSNQEYATVIQPSLEKNFSYKFTYNKFNLN